MEASRRYISGAAKPGVYMGRMKLPSLDSTSRAAPKSIITALLSSVMKMLAGLMSRCSILCWCTMRRPRSTSSNSERMVDSRKTFCVFRSRAVMMKSCRVAPSR
jgi:hypothetical protein